MSDDFEKARDKALSQTTASMDQGLAMLLDVFRDWGPRLPLVVRRIISGRMAAADNPAASEEERVEGIISMCAMLGMLKVLSVLVKPDSETEEDDNG